MNKTIKIREIEKKNIWIRIMKIIEKIYKIELLQS